MKGIKYMTRREKGREKEGGRRDGKSGETRQDYHVWKSSTNDEDELSRSQTEIAPLFSI